jgi:hypothetical protein
MWQIYDDLIAGVPPDLRVGEWQLILIARALV